MSDSDSLLVKTLRQALESPPLFFDELDMSFTIATLTKRVRSEIPRPVSEDLIEKFKDKVALENRMIELLPFWIIIEDYFNADPASITRSALLTLSAFTRTQANNDSKDATAWGIYAACEMCLGNRMEIEEILLRAVSINLDYAAGWLMLGCVYHSNSDFIAATDAFLTAHNLDKENKVIEHYANWFSKKYKSS